MASQREIGKLSEVLQAAKTKECKGHEWIGSEYLRDFGEGVYDRVCTVCGLVERVSPEYESVPDFADVVEAKHGTTIKDSLVAAMRVDVAKPKEVNRGDT